MFYLIDRGVVAQIEENKFAIGNSSLLFWVEADSGIAEVGDKYSDNIFSKKDSLDERKKIRLFELASTRDNFITSGVTVNDHSFFTDDASINTILQSITMQGFGIKSVFPRPWILTDGSVIEVSYEEMKDVAIAISEKKETAYANYMILAAQINTSDNPESININQGWSA